MSDAANTPLPPEEICAQAQGNAAAWVLTMIAYLKERGSAVEDCVAYHGRRFAPAWEELRGRPVEEVAQLVALNSLSVGSTLRSLSSDDGRAEVLVEGWPDEELLGFLPLDRDDCDQIWNTYEPIMDHLGLHYAWQRQDDVVRMTSNCRVVSNEQPWHVACYAVLITPLGRSSKNASYRHLGE